MPKGHVMTKQFVLKPMKDTMLDYTWRTRGKEVLLCPVCKKHGTPRTVNDKIVMLHREVISDFRAAHPVEYCETENEEIRAAMVRKEKARLYSFEYAERMRAEKAARKTARHKKFLLEHYGGQSMTEIALLLPLFCLLLFGTIDLGRLIQAHTRVSNAAHSAMRYAQNVENGDTTTAVTVNAITNTVQTHYPGVTITINQTKIYSNESLVVTAAYPFSMITPFVRNMVGQTQVTQAITGTTLP